LRGIKRGPQGEGVETVKMWAPPRSVSGPQGKRNTPAFKSSPRGQNFSKPPEGGP